MMKVNNYKIKSMHIQRQNLKLKKQDHCPKKHQVKPIR